MLFTVNFDVIDIILTLVVCLNLFLGFLVLFNGPKKQINVVYALNIVAIISWVGSMILYRSASISTSIVWATILYIAPTVIASSFLYFTYIFPSSQQKVDQRKVAIIFSINAVIALLVALPGIIISTVHIRPGSEKEILFGHYYGLYVLYILIFFTFGFTRLFVRLRKETGSKKMQIAYLLLGYAIAANLAFITNLIMPWIGLFFLNWLGQIFTVFMVGFTAYAIIRHRLMDIRVVVTQLFVIALWAILLFRVLVTPFGSEEQVINAATLLFTVVVGGLLVRSVLKEVRQRESIERLNNELQKANQTLHDLMNMRTEFLQIASHQLRTPVSVMRGMLDMLREDGDSMPAQQRKEFIDRALSKSEKLTNIISDILSATEMDVSNFDVASIAKPINLVEITRLIVESEQADAKDRGLTLEFDAESASLLIKSSDVYLPQAITNLIDNAIKYTEHGSVTVHVSQDGNDAVLAVSDTGIGVSPEEAKKLWAKFSRAQNAKDMYTDGSGLGLFIVKKVIEGHSGGSVFMTSEAKKGSTFGFRLPMMKEGTHEKSS